MSEDKQVYDYTRAEDPEEGYKLWPVQFNQLLHRFQIELSIVPGLTMEAEAVEEAIEYFNVKFIPLQNNAKKICVKNGNDILKFCNLNYIVFGPQQILQLLRCYHHVKDYKKASKIWIYNQEDAFDEKNRFGIDERDCF